MVFKLIPLLKRFQEVLLSGVDSLPNLRKLMLLLIGSTVIEHKRRVYIGDDMFRQLLSLALSWQNITQRQIDFGRSLNRKENEVRCYLLSRNDTKQT